MTPDKIKEQAVERIYLFPGEHDGETTLLWGDDPAPGEGMDAAEAVEYVRKDVADARIAELERERDMHKAAEEAQIALRQKADERVAGLEAHVERIIAARNSRRGDTLANICAVIDESTHQTSLARRDLIKQAEALEEICSCGELLSNRDILGMAQGLRQQAEAL